MTLQVNCQDFHLSTPRTLHHCLPQPALRRLGNLTPWRLQTHLLVQYQSTQRHHASQCKCDP